jgi:adenylate kinase family enzyme
VLPLTTSRSGTIDPCRRKAQADLLNIGKPTERATSGIAPDLRLRKGHQKMQLTDLGERICILGPSNSGKSTLAEAIARKRGLELVHLDLLYHLPNTDWEVRHTDEFVALHDAAITGEKWVIDGDYSKCMPQRFARATGLILLDISTPASLFRYWRRTLFERERVGALEGGRDSIKWDMIYHIAVVTPKNRKRYANMFHDIDLPKVRLMSIRAIKQCYQRWGLG